MARHRRPAPLNFAPTAHDDIITMDKNTSMKLTGLLLNDTDPDRDGLSILSVGAAAHGSLSLKKGVVTYTPVKNYSGADSFSYTISDGHGHTDTATVHITVKGGVVTPPPVNHAPDAVNDTATTKEDTAVVITNLKANDTDADGNALAIASVGAAAHGTAVLSNGNVTYTPNANFNGTDSFTYTVNDGQGGTDTATVNLTISAVNDAPVVKTAIVGQAMSEGETRQINLANLFADVDGDTMVLTVSGAPFASVTGTILTLATHDGQNGNYTLVVGASDAHGGTASYTIAVSVADSITSTNHVPDAINDTATTAEDTAIVLAGLKANDTDVDGNALTITSVGAAAHGAAVLNSNGNVTYTPTANYHGTDSFTYTVNDGHGGTDTATVNLTVNAVNDSPVVKTAVAAQAMNEGETKQINLANLFSDVDGDALTLAVSGAPFASLSGMTLTLAPVDGQNGNKTLVIGANDGHGGTASYNLTVNVADSITPTPPGGGGGTGGTTPPAGPDNLFQIGDLQYVGSFRIPGGTHGDSLIAYGGTALAYNPVNNSLFMVGHPYDNDIAEFKIPNLTNSSNINALQMATILQPFTDVVHNLPNWPITDSWHIGDLLVVDGKLIGDVYEYYDADASVYQSHFTLDSTNLSTAHVDGLFQVGTLNAGYVAGYMEAVPTEFQSLLGGAEYVTGKGEMAIISRTSLGPALFGFDPSDLGHGIAPADPLVYYPLSHPLAGSWESPINNGNSDISGVAFVPTTNTVLFFGSTGTSEVFYGLPEDANDTNRGGKGYHAVDGHYSYMIWAYDANDLAAVNSGAKQAWDINPYEVWTFNLPFPQGSTYIGGTAYDPSTGYLYVSQMYADQQGYDPNPIISVFDLTPTLGLHGSASVFGGVAGIDLHYLHTGTEAIDMGTGLDAVGIYMNTETDLVLSDGHLKGVELIDMRNEINDIKAPVNDTKLNIADILTMSDTHDLHIFGDAGKDTVTVTGALTRGANTHEYGVDFAHYSASNGADLYVQIGLDLNGQKVV